MRKYSIPIIVFEHGLALVMLNNRLGFVNERGIEIIPPTYKHDELNASEIEQGIIRVLEDGEWKTIKVKE